MNKPEYGKLRSYSERSLSSGSDHSLVTYSGSAEASAAARSGFGG